MYLLTSSDRGRSFKEDLVSQWELNACPMTTDCISEAGADALIAWQTEGQVYYATAFRSDPQSLGCRRCAGSRKRSEISRCGQNSQGDVLLAWTEGTAWKRGGSLAWQVFDAQGRPSEVKGGAPGVPVWGLVAVFSDSRGGF